MLTGSCLCGRVRYEIHGKLGPVTHCHCVTCRKAQGGPFVTSAPLRTKYFRLVSGADAVAEFESSPGKKRCSCRNCGSPVWSRRDADPDIIRIRLGLLDADPGRRPLAHTWVSEKAPWYEITDDLPRSEGSGEELRAQGKASPAARTEEVAIMPQTTILPDVGEQLRPLIETLPLGIQPRILARLERGAADRYRAWAASCPDPVQAEGLRACAAREEEIATRVEKIFPSQPDEQQQISTVLPAIAKIYRSALAERPRVEQYAIQAASERRGAALWRSLAASLTDASVCAPLLACADLEESSAEFLEALVNRKA